MLDVISPDSQYHVTPNRQQALSYSGGVLFLQVPTVVEALVKGPWDPDGAIWGRQLDMALEVRASARQPAWYNDLRWLT